MGYSVVGECVGDGGDAEEVVEEAVVGEGVEELVAAS